MNAKVLVFLVAVISNTYGQIGGIQFGDGFYSFVRTTSRRPVWHQNYIENQQSFNQNQHTTQNPFPNQNRQDRFQFVNQIQFPNGNQYENQNQFPNRNQSPNDNQFQNGNQFQNIPVHNENFAARGPASNHAQWNFHQDDSCETLDGSVGSCINIKRCRPYTELLRNLRSNPQAANILRRSRCGFEGNDPKVCCPTVPITILQPQTTTTTQEPTSQTPQPAPPQPQPETTRPQVEPQTPKPGDLNTHEPLVDGTVNDGGSNDISQFVASLPEPPVCGFSNATNTRVVGGVNAKLGAFPWMALLGYHSARYPDQARWLCGGSLVTSRHVLTAAHCIHGRENTLYLVRLGELDLDRDDDGATPIDVPIKKMIRHEDYSAKAFTNDIGLLMLARNVQFTELIRPICLPRSSRLRSLSFERYNPFIAGWGDTEFRGPSASHLQVLQLPVVSNSFCANAYKAYKAQVIDERVLCAGFEKGGKDACQGDSGGPLMQPDYNPESRNIFFYQIGVVSYGRKCAEAGYPGVYSRTTYFMPWLYNQLLGQNLD